MGPSSPHVRSALASVTVLLAPVLGKERTLDQLVPLLVRQLKDEVSVGKDRRLNRFDSRVFL